MPDAAERLTRDPVFQINCCLWLVQQPGIQRDGRRPSFASHGFVLRALGRKLANSPATKAKFRELGWSPAPPEPDVLIKHAATHKHLVLECKASSFSPSSSTSTQARKLLALCAEPDSALGVPAKAFVVYVLTESDCERQQSTLRDLSREIVESGLPVAEAGTLGLTFEDGSLWAVLSIATVGGDREIESIRGKNWIADGDDEGARPLYIIPYDPAAADNQDPKELEYCTKQLLERCLTSAMQIVGRSFVPDDVCISADEILRMATFNVSDKWHAAGDVNKLKGRIANELGRVLMRGDFKDKVTMHDRSVTITLATHDDQEAALSLLLKTQTEQVAARIAVPQLNLPIAGS